MTSTSTSLMAPRRPRAVWWLVLSAVVLNASLTGKLQAATVTTLNDSGPGSLRDVLATAPPYANITFAVTLPGTITLTSGELPVTAPHGIIGPGADLLTISGNHASRVFNISGGTVVMSGLTIANGHAVGGDGGGILCSSPGGLSLSLVTIRDNVADGNGGGLYFSVASMQSGASFAASTFSGNQAGGSGGGFYLDSIDSLDLYNVTISGNSARADGGGLFRRGSGGSRFFGVTITQNTADSDGDGIGNGGGIYNHLTDNFEIMDVIVAENYDTPNNSGASLKHPDLSGPFYSYGYNLIGDTTGATITGFPNLLSHDIIGVSPMLGPLANNGGPTFTHALLPNSPAIDAGTYWDPSNMDQRLFFREEDGNCDGVAVTDIGAFEVQFSSLPMNQPPPTIVSVTADCHTLKVTVLFSGPVNLATVQTPGDYQIAGGTVAVNTAAYGPNRQTVILDTVGLAAGVSYTLTVGSVQHLCGTATASRGPAPFACPSEIRGRKFKEVVLDCVQSGALEIPLVNWIIQLNGGLQTTKTDANGDYYFIVPPGSYTVSELPKPYWTQVCPVGSGTYTVPIGAGQLAPNINFGNKAISAVQDLSVAIFPTYPPPLQAPCCDQLMTYAITLANQGNAGVVNSSITFWLLAGTTFQSALPPPTTQSPLISPTTFTWVFPAQINPGATRTVYVTVMVNSCNPFALVPPTLTAKATVTADGPGSLTPADNTTTHNVQVSCSYDPNDKQVSPLGCGFDGLVPLDTTFTYLVQFQNTGSGSAQQVIVRDTLDNALDLATVETIGASHTYLFAVNGRELIWTFPAIQLPAMSLDEPASHGWMKFRVRPRANAPAGTFIQNSARIYFDLNPPVFTATTFNTLTDDPLPVTSFNINSVPSQENAFDFTYTGGTAGANLLWEFGPNATPPTSEETNPTGVVFTGTGLKRALLRVMLDDCVSEPAVRVFRVGRPVLNVRREGQRVVLSWLGAGFTLQETDQLDTSATWNNSTLEVMNQMAGDELSNEAAFTVPDGIAKRFFRLSEVQ